MADVVGQIGEIRSRLAMLGPQQPASADGGTAFASALSGASATSATSATSAAGSTLTGTGVTGDDVVQSALKYKGVPYVLGGESKSGIDCSGLVQSTFKDLGVSVPRLVHEQQTIGQKVDSLKDAKPGDLIVLNGGDHVAIWMGNDTVIHAPYPGRSVSVQKAWFDDKDVTAIRRVVPATDDAATAAAGATGVSASTLAQAVGMVGESGSADSSSLSSMLSSLGSSGSSTTAQQLLAARSAMLSTGA